MKRHSAALDVVTVSADAQLSLERIAGPDDD
jgi:hypothetical protein